MYMPERSVAEGRQYLFEYHVRISNVGAETAQLISREWIITNADGEVERVKGPGVVGEQPVLAPGASFEYRSFCPLKTPVGSMHGSYQMVTAQRRPVRRDHLTLHAGRPERAELKSVARCSIQIRSFSESPISTLARREVFLPPLRDRRAPSRSSHDSSFGNPGFSRASMTIGPL